MRANGRWAELPVVVRLRAISAGLLVAGAIGGVRILVDPPGAWLLVILILLVLASPVSRSLSRRILISGSIVLGWMPILWWIPLPAAFDRMALFVAIASGALAALLVHIATVSGSWKVIFPRLRSVDSIPFVTGALALWVAAPFLTARDNLAALSLLMKSGWDHVAHFHMVRLLSSQGSVYPTFGASPDGSNWIGSIYPKHFHALVSSVIGLLNEQHHLSDAVSPSSYSVGVAVVVIASVVTLAAGVAQLPTLQRSPWVAGGLAGLVVAAYLFGAGTTAFSAGFPNFIVGCATASLASFIVLGMTKAVQPLQAFTLAGLIVATAHSWLLLLPLSSAVALTIIWPLRVRWRSSRLRFFATLGCILTAVIGVLTAVAIVIPEISSSTITTGGSEAFASGTLVAVLFTSIGCAVFVLRSRPHGKLSLSLRTALLGAVPAAGLVMLLGLGWYQLHHGGALSYYFSKLATGTLLVALCSLVIALASLVPAAQSGGNRTGRAISAVGGAALIVASFQFFGYVGPLFGAAVPELASGLTYRAAAMSVVSAQESAEAKRLISAAKIASRLGFTPTLYVATLPGDQLPHLANQWHLALAGNWTSKEDSYSALLDSHDFTDALAKGQLGAAITKILEDHTTLRVIVAPTTYTEIAPNIPVLVSSRLLSW